ncbi:hypothetical protein PMAYCL1PPCAC_31722, partial [Pristionchus mayeri]
LEHLLVVHLQIIRSGRLEEGHVLIRVKANHLIVHRRSTYVYFQIAVDAVVEQQMVGHADAVRLHHVTLPVVVVTDVRFIVVGDTALRMILNGSIHGRHP